MRLTRRMAFTGPVLAAVLCTAVPGRVSAQESDSARIAELERRIDAMTREIERLSLGGDVVVADTSVRGFGPAASRVYRIGQGVSVGGYGELLYENFAAEQEDGTPAGIPDQLDALRAILYVGYKFNDRLLFNSEIEIEHADEISLEFAYLDYLLGESWGVRAGMLLAPLGLVNELHEPPTFLGTERAVTENRIIPTTWRENGIGLFGGGEAVSWRVYLMNSLDASGFGAAGLRGGRQKGSHALAEDMGLAARLDYVATPGLLAGVSVFGGETAQGVRTGGTDVGGRLVIWDAHLDYERAGWDLRALVARARLDNAALVNDMNGLTGTAGVGSEMLGWYVQAGYDVLQGRRGTHQLIPYARFERVDTQRETPTGFGSDPSNELSVTSLGVAWKPIGQVVAKLGYQLHSNEANTGVNQWNVHLGWLF